MSEQPDPKPEPKPKPSKGAIEAFMADIETVCRKHQISIGHEDGHGAFLVQAFEPDLMAWLRDARPR